MAIDTYNVRERLTFNPARVARIPKSAPKGRPDRRTLTPEQVAAFMDTVQGDPLESLFLHVACVGLRPGEACGLPWSAVDLEAGTLDVVQFRRVTRTDGGVDVTMAGPKAGSVIAAWIYTPAPSPPRNGARREDTEGATPRVEGVGRKRFGRDHGDRRTNRPVEPSPLPSRRVCRTTPESSWKAARR